MSGSLTIVGLGPGGSELITRSAQQAIERATDLVGYGPYLERIPVNGSAQRRHATGNREEIQRARHALQLAAIGQNVAVISGGDPGVFAMAAAVFEAVESGPESWRTLDIRIEPGVTAMLAAAAQAGAPLGSDFCAISLSDNLKSWARIKYRLTAAAEADFAIALYNPSSSARPHQFGEALEVLRTIKPEDTIVIFVRAAGTPDAQLTATTLIDADPTQADMRTLVIIGSSQTRIIERDGLAPWIYTSRSELGSEE